MWKYIKRFFDCESGAITVDWVVLTASVVALAFAAWASVYESSVTGVASTTGDALSAYSDEIFQ